MLTHQILKFVPRILACVPKRYQSCRLFQSSTFGNDLLSGSFHSSKPRKIFIKAWKYISVALIVWWRKLSIGSRTKSAACQRARSTYPTLKPSQEPFKVPEKSLPPIITSRMLPKCLVDFAIAPNESTAGDIPDTPPVFAHPTVYLRAQRAVQVAN